MLPLVFHEQNVWLLMDKLVGMGLILTVSLAPAVSSVNSKKNQFHSENVFKNVILNLFSGSLGQPPDPAHGWHAGECYTFGCRVTYHCGEGYELVGKSERFCQATGDWSPKEMPTCVRK